MSHLKDNIINRRNNQLVISSPGQFHMGILEALAHMMSDLVCRLLQIYSVVVIVFYTKVLNMVLIEW